MKKYRIKIFFIITFVLIIAWALRFVGYTTGSIVLILILVVAIAIILKVIQTKLPIKKKFHKYKSINK